MARGVTPRQPARTGRQDNVRATKPVAKTPGRGKGIGSASKRRAKSGAAGKYDPVAPERVADILNRLDQLYPDVKCALTHASAWELLVATILSAQSTDVNVNRVTPELFRKYP